MKLPKPATLFGLPPWLAYEAADPVPYFRAGLGIPIGPLMEALIDLYMGEDLAFSHHLDFTLTPDARETHANVIPFAHTRGGDVFGFIVTDDARASTDVRPVCRVSQKRTHVVAPDLARFLSLLAIAGTGPIAREGTDLEYQKAREELLRDPDCAEEARPLLDFLAELPGVRVPSRPGAVTLR